MLPGGGSPTIQYMTIYQLKKLGVPARSATVKQITMQDIENVETIVHLHWLTQQFPGAGGGADRKDRFGGVFADERDPVRLRAADLRDDPGPDETDRGASCPASKGPAAGARPSTTRSSSGTGSLGRRRCG